MPSSQVKILFPARRLMVSAINMDAVSVGNRNQVKTKKERR